MPIKFRAQSQEEADILIYGDIGESFWSEESVTAKSFRKDLDAVGNVKRLNIYINSSGGNIFDAQAIFSMLQRHAAQKTVYVDGIAASAASVIAMAGDKIIMPVNALIMIHRAWTFMAGNSNDMRKIADTLEIIDRTIIEVFSARTGLEEDKIIELMDVETWMTAEEAISYGFADEIEQAKQIAASIRNNILTINGNVFDLSKFKNLSKLETLLEIRNGVVPNDVSKEKAPEEEAWESPNLSDFTDESWEDLSDSEKRRIAGHFAWANEMPPEKFGNLKLPHHRPSDGAIVRRGVNNALARLPQTDIPEEDKDKVRSHLENHSRQFEDRNQQKILNEGRTLSAANEQRIIKSRDLLDEVLDQLDKEPESADKKAQQPEPRQTDSSLSFLYKVKANKNKTKGR